MLARRPVAFLILCLATLLTAACSHAGEADEPLDPDVLRKIKKLVKGTLAEDTKEREKAWTDIREMGNLVTPGLLELTKQKETTPAMSQSILIALGDSKDPRAGPALLDLLKSPEAAVRKGAARALGDCRYKPASQPLDAVAKNEKENEDVRLFAAVAGAKLGSEASVGALMTLMKSEKSETRSRAVFALGKYGGIKHAAAIESALDDADDSVREDAVEALRLLKEKPAWAGLIKATRDANFKIRGSAMDALHDLTKQKFDREPKIWQEWWEKHKDDPETKPEAKKKDSLKESF